MIDPSAPKHAERLLTVPEEAKVLQDAVTDVLDRGISLRARPLVYGVIRAWRALRDWSGKQGFDAYRRVAGGELRVQGCQRGVAGLGEGSEVGVGPQFVTLVVACGDRAPHGVQFVRLVRPKDTLVRPELARPRNVRKEGAVNSGPKPVSSVISDAGTGSVASGSIGRNPFQRRVSEAPPMLPYLRRLLMYPQITQRVGQGYASTSAMKAALASV
jgi:hypothetical protein